MRKRRLDEEDIALLVPLTMKVVKTVGKRRELKCTGFPRSKKSVSIKKNIVSNITTAQEGILQ